MRVLLAVFFSFFFIVGVARAQVLDADQVINTPYTGWIKAVGQFTPLIASSTPFFESFFATLGNIGTLTLPGQTSALLQTNGSGVVSEYAGTTCTNQFVRALSALGVATCATVQNTDLANSTVSYGGVTLSLGGTDATPAFNLVDATGLPIVGGTTGTLTVARGGTGSTTAPAGQLLYGGGDGTYQSVATTSASCTGNASCTPFTVIGATPITINATGGSGSGVGTIATSSLETATYIPYYTSSSAYPALLSGGESTFAYNETDNRVSVTYASTTGISTSYASSTAGFFGSATIGSITGLLKATAGLVSQAVAGTDYVAGGTGANTQVTYFTGSGVIAGDAGMTYNATDDRLTVTNASTTNITSTGGAQFATNNGNVGVGSSSPAARLTVQNDNETTSLFSVGSSTNVSLLVNNAGRLIVNGTTSPLSALLTINSTDALGNVGTILNMVQRKAQSSSNGAFGVFTQDDGSAIVSGSRLGGFAFGGSRDAAHSLTNSVAIEAFSAENWNSTSAGSYLRFATIANTTTTRTERMRITDSGNVGIGTTSPGRALSVQGDASLSGDLFSANITATGTLNLPALSDGCLNITSGAVGSTGSACGSGGGSGTVGSGTTGQFPYYASAGTTLTATSSLFIDSIGEIGIGTTSPGRALSVQGSANLSGDLFAANITATGTVSVSSAGVILDNNDTGTGVTLQSAALPGSVTATFPMVTGTVALGTGSVNQVGYWSATNSLTAESAFSYIAANDSLGIGTSTPNRTLTIASSTAPQLSLSDASLTSNSWQLRSISNNLYIATSSPSTFATSTVAALRFDQNGLPDFALCPRILTVLCSGSGGLVRTTSPAIVTPTFTTSATGPLFYGGSAAGSTLTLRSTSGVGVGADAIIFGVGNNGAVERGRMTLGGFGLGTTTPRAALNIASSTASQLMLSDGTATSLPWNIRSISGSLYIATSSVTTFATSTLPALSISTGGQVSALEYTVATSTTMVVDWNTTPNQITLRTGTGATTIGFNNASTTGMTKRIVVCNPTATAGAITWSVGTLRWTGGTVPTQTTTANKCDIWSFIVSAATSTTVILGAQTPNF